MRTGEQGQVRARHGLDDVGLRGILCLGLLMGVLEQVGRFLPSQLPRRHLDSSWMIGLELARDAGVQHGSDVVFTYGPWGFLSSPTGIDLGSQVASGVLRALAVAALFVALASSLRERRWRIAAAATLALLMSNGGHPEWILMLALMVWTLTSVSRATDLPWWSIALAAGTAAFLCQVKLTVGVMAVALVALLVLSHRRRPSALLVATCAFAAAFAALWLLAGQSLTAVLDWFRLGAEIVVGYNDAMGYSDATVLVFSLVVVVMLAAAVTATARPLGWIARAGFLGALVFFVKVSLSLPDVGHLLPGYAGVVGVMAVLLGLSLSRPARWAVTAAVGYLCLLLTIGLPVLPKRAASLDALSVGDSRADRSDRLASARADLKGDLGLGTGVLAALQHHPVSVDPWEISVVWAYDLEWRPLPVFQQYSAYTPRLDSENVAALLSDPERRVLREEVVYPDYNPLWVAPAYTLALVCNFETVASDGEWSVLARGADRCGEERTVSTQRVAAGEQVILHTSATSLVAVRFEPDSRSLADQLLGVSGVQRHRLNATLDGQRYRVAEALAGGPLVVGSPETEPVLFDVSSATTISFDRAGELEVAQIPLISG